MNNSELNATTMISMVRFAIIVLMAFRDLRFLSTVFLAHFTRLIFSFPLSNDFYFSIQIRFLKKPGSSNKTSRLANMGVLPCQGVRELIVPRGNDCHGVRVARGESESASRLSASRFTVAADVEGYCRSRVRCHGAGVSCPGRV